MDNKLTNAIKIFYTSPYTYKVIHKRLIFNKILQTHSKKNVKDQAKMAGTIIPYFEDRFLVWPKQKGDSSGRRVCARTSGSPPRIYLNIMFPQTFCTSSHSL